MNVFQRCLYSKKVIYLILKLHSRFESFKWYSRKKKKGSCEFEEHVQEHVKQQGKKGSCEFEEYVQDHVKQQGFVLTEEEEKMVQDAIARRLAENKDSGVELDDSEFEDAPEVEEVFS